MFSIDSGKAGYLRVHATGRLTPSDYDRLEPAIEDALRQDQDERGRRAPALTGSGLRLLLDLTGWRGWTPGGLLRDICFDIRHRKSFPRIAVVGDRIWHKWLTYAAKPVFRGEMRYFDAAREREAVEWVQGGLPRSRPD
jgi:hypothetical protein